MKIALIKPSATYADWYKYPALNLAYISTCLEINGFECMIFDAYFYSWSEKELLQRVIDYNPDIIGLSAMTHEIVQAAHIASQIKKLLNVPTIVGGCHVTALPERTLTEFPIFDYGVYGEGEKTTLELMRYLHKDTKVDLNSIKGLVFRDGSHIVVNDARPFLTSEELDSLPFPDYHHYYNDNPQALRNKNLCYLIFSSRGCPYNCAFCMRVLGNKIRQRSAENICQEIEYAMSRYGAHTFDISDEIFIFDNQKTREVLFAMIERGFPKRIRWSANARANQVNPDIIALAKKAGCFRLGIGVESGDDEVLKAIGKGITVKDVKRAVRIIKELGISVGTYFILGHPNETRETLRKTINLAAELNTDTIAVGLMVPYPGTRIYDMALRGEGRYRLISQDWSDYDKYGKKVLEIEGLPYEELVRWQKRALINFYAKNFKFLDCFKYFWQRRRAIYFFAIQRLSFLKKKKVFNV